jgi:hypothetical protein
MRAAWFFVTRTRIGCIYEQPSFRLRAIDLKGRNVGSSLDLPAPVARLLLTESWTIPGRRLRERTRF